MKRSRWTRKLYEYERKQCNLDPSASNWCSYTRDLLTAIGLSECWKRQRAVQPSEMDLKVVRNTLRPHLTEWKTVSWRATRAYEQSQWRREMERKPKLTLYRQWKTTLRRERYLSSPDLLGRVALFSLRSGTNDLRIDTGRNERIVDPRNGKRRRLQRAERVCKQCEVGVEDEIHVLLYCPRYVFLRRDFLLDLKRERPEDLGLETFLLGLCQVNTIEWDQEEAQKVTSMMMEKDRIPQTMELVKKIMCRRKALIRDREGMAETDSDTEESESPVNLKPSRTVGRQGTNEVRSRRRRNGKRTTESAEKRTTS